MKKTIYILLIALFLIIFFACFYPYFIGAGEGLRNIYTWVTYEPDKLADNRPVSVISSKEVEEVSSIVNPNVTDVDSNPASSSVDQEMLDYVIMCESSGRHEGIWGRDGEYGILQWKQETWDYLSEELNYQGDWQNRDDQIDFFLIAVQEGYGGYWTCFRKWTNTGQFGL